MARKEIHTNHRLVITPDTPTFYLSSKHDAARALLDDMATAVRRHIDHVGAVTAVWDTRAECSHCGREWETVEATDLAEHPDAFAGFIVGEPVCCGQAADEFRANQAGEA